MSSKFPTLFIVLIFGITLLTAYMPLRFHDLLIFVPAFAALICVVFEREGVFDRLFTLFKPGSPKDMLIGLAIPLIALFIFMFIAYVFAFADFGWDPVTLNFNQGNSWLIFKKKIMAGFPQAFLIGFLYAFAAEMGWRGYLLNRFKQSGLGFWGRALAVGLVWGLWHVVAYRNLNMGNLQFGIFLVNICLISVVISWVYERSQSIWAAAIMHYGHSFLFSYFLGTYTLKEHGPNWLHGTAGVLMTAAYATVVLFLIARKKI